METIALKFFCFIIFSIFKNNSLKINETEVEFFKECNNNPYCVKLKSINDINPQELKIYETCLEGCKKNVFSECSSSCFCKLTKISLENHTLLNQCSMFVKKCVDVSESFVKNNQIYTSLQKEKNNYDFNYYFHSCLVRQQHVKYMDSLKYIKVIKASLNAQNTFECFEEEIKACKFIKNYF